MSLTALITASDISDRYQALVDTALLTSSTSVLTDIANAAIGQIKKKLGYNPQVDSVTGLASATEILNGGRPVITLLSKINTTSSGVVLTVKELGATLTRRSTFPASPGVATGDYFIGDEGYALYRLAGSGARTLGIWGGNSSAPTISGFPNTTTGGLRLQGEYTDSYRGTIEITYTPDVDIALLKNIALQLCRLELLENASASAVGTVDQSISINFPQDASSERRKILKTLPAPILIGTGS